MEQAGAAKDAHVTNGLRGLQDLVAKRHSVTGSLVTSVLMPASEMISARKGPSVGRVGISVRAIAARGVRSGRVRTAGKDARSSHAVIAPRVAASSPVKTAARDVPSNRVEIVLKDVPSNHARIVARVVLSSREIVTTARRAVRVPGVPRIKNFRTGNSARSGPMRRAARAAIHVRLASIVMIVRNVTTARVSTATIGRHAARRTVVRAGISAAVRIAVTISHGRSAVRPATVIAVRPAAKVVVSISRVSIVAIASVHASRALVPTARVRIARRVAAAQTEPTGTSIRVAKIAGMTARAATTRTTPRFS